MDSNVRRSSKMKALTPSSATAGFFQTAPHLSNQFDDDHILRHLIDCESVISRVNETTAH